MGFIQNIICIALLLIGIAFIFGVTYMPDEQQECLEEIAEDYCEDNGFVFESIHIYNPIIPGGFECREDERSIKRKLYKFLDDEIEECEGKK